MKNCKTCAARKGRGFDGECPLHASRRAVEERKECTCYRECGDDSLSGDWHQHEDDPCPTHPDAPMVG